MTRATRYLSHIRLGLFPLGYGLTGALVGGTLNRVMIADLGLPASLIGLFFALPLLESPLRLWLGHRSDGHPLWGRRREPYILIGALLSAAGLVMAASLAVHIADASWVMVAGGVLAFLIYGLGRNLTHNIFQALVADRFDPAQRPRAVTAYEVVTVLGLIAGAGGLGEALEVYDPARLLAVTLAVAVLVLLLTLVAVIGQEPLGEQVRAAAERARELRFMDALRTLIAADPQVRLFFVLILCTVVGTMAQDVILEPYGALVLGMAVGETTRLTMYWGIGVLSAMLVAGNLLIPRFGFLVVLRVGIVLSIVVFAGVIAAGWAGQPELFKVLVGAMGLGTGLAGAGVLSGAIAFTTLLRAGLMMGLWGMANVFGKAVGSLFGGGLVDLFQHLGGGNALLSYGVVFALEVVLLVIALWLSTRVRIGSARIVDEQRAPSDVREPEQLAE